jgi:D-alanyl-D-alanine carboxypeptidase
MNSMMRGVMPAATIPYGARVSAAPVDGLSAPERARVDTAVNQFLQDRVPGISLAVIKSGAVVYAKGYGVMDLESRRPVTATTHMEIGSVTIQFTAAAILQLAETGKLSLDDKLGTYVPEYAAGRDVTLRQLLQFTSGVPEYFPNDDAVAGQVFAKKTTVKEVLDLFADKPLDFAAGTRAAFNSTNYFLLGLVIERASGMDYAAYMKRNIFGRAGMTRTTTIADEEKLKDLARGYNDVGGSMHPTAKTDDLWGRATFDVVSDVIDMAKWDAALLNGKIVNRDDVALMMTPATLPNGARAPYGMSWIQNQIDEHNMIWRDGGTIGFVAMNAIYPDDHLILIAEANANYLVVSPRSITAAVFDALHPELLAKRLTPAAGEDAAITVRAREMIRALQTGTVERSVLTEQLSEKLTPAALDKIKVVLAVAGEPRDLIFKGQQSSQTGATYDYLVRFKNQNWSFRMAVDASGKCSSIGLGPA